MSLSSTSTEPLPAAGATPPSGLRPFPREIRLGLVMYGGVSLAVYINGVATEFFHAVQGTGIYGLLKCLRNSHIAVDIISGASAGGINGILLGCALTGDGRNLEQTTRLWREKGGIADLLHRPGAATPTSLFDGESYYLRELTTCFRDLADGQSTPTPTGIPSPIDALDLFVTGTDYHGKTWLWHDALGSPIPVKDHRGVFRLRYRRGRADANDFADPAALAKLARITSSFPAALAPVPVAASAAKGSPPSTPDQHLTTWGQLTAGTTRHFIDGGVLDNKPFSDTIEQIYYRTAHLPVDRKLFFVEPDPETFTAEDSAPPGPDILGVITRSLITLPRYESIAGDLRQIDRLNRSLADRAELIDKLAIPANRPMPTPAQEKLYQGWRWRWLQELVEAAAADTAARHGRDSAPAPPAFATFSPSIDVEFSLRRLFHVTYRLYDSMYVGDQCMAAVDPPAVTRLDVARETLRALNRHIQLLKLVRSMVERAVIDWAGPGERCAKRRELSDVLLALLEAVELRRGDRGDDDDLSDCGLDRVKQQLADRLANPAARVPTSGPTILDQEANLSQRILSARSEMAGARHDYVDFSNLDKHVYPFELAAGIREKDPIETIRISARDARLGFSRRSPEEKVSGDALAHFGGFFKRTWRSNDILWGRLDARCQLVRGLLRSDELKARLALPTERRALRDNLDALARQHETTRGELAAHLFPAGDEAGRSELQRWLDRLTSDDPKEVEQAATEVDAKLDTIVRLAQADIVKSGVADVEHDAKSEATTWGEPDFEFPKGLDAAALARSTTEFRTHYRVGEERLSKDIPPRVLLGIFAQGALILRDAVFGAADQRVQKRGRILARPLQFTRKLLGWPLQLAYWYATITRARAMRIGAAIVAATLFAVLVWQGKDLLGSTRGDDGFELRWLNVLVFLGFPALVFSGEVALGHMPRLTKRPHLWQTLLGVARWTLVAALRCALVAVPLGLVLWGLVTGRYAGLVDWFTSFDVKQQLALVGSPVLLAAGLLYLMERLR